MSIPVHPAADCFRLMTREELEALAADIKENGLTDPIVIGQINGDVAEFIVDGRNRMAACNLIKMQPKFERRQFADDDAVRAFVKSRGERRDLTKGQRAMSMAMLFPDPSKGGRGNKNPSETKGFSLARLSQARQVLRNNPELAKRVRDGVTPLDEAVKQVQDVLRALENAEACMERLRREAPDLADLVTEERLKLHEAMTALDSRISESKRQQETATRVLQSIFNAIYPRGASPQDWARRLTDDVSEDFWGGADELTFENLYACADVMREIANRWKDRNG